MNRQSELVSLKRVELSISRLSLGTAPLGGLFKSVSETESDAILRAALAAGINFIDTAPLYGYGVAERRIGKFLSDDQPNLVLSTKVGRLIRTGKNQEHDKFPDSDPNHEIYFDYSEQGIRKSLESSLERLKRDTIDIALIHDADEWIQPAIDVVYPTLEKMRSEGLLRAIGIGMNWCPPSIKIMENTDLDIALIAGRFTLLDQTAQHDLYPLAKRKNVSIIAAGIFNSGILANPVPGSYFDYEPARETVLARALAIKEVLARHSVPLTAAALQFPLRHSAVTTVLTGAGSAQELQANIADFNLPISDAVWDELEAARLIEPISD